MDQMRSEQPSCFNGIVSYRKYRVTVELIDEPHDVLEARLRKLWEECDNHHNWTPLKNAAKELGVDLGQPFRKTKQGMKRL